MRAALAFLAALLCAAANAQTLYAVSLRTFSDAQYSGSEGSIYTVDPGSAALSLVAGLRLGSAATGLDGLAIHPETGLFYGITAPTSKSSPGSLVSVDAKTGELKLIGPLGHAASDIAFDRDGTLYAWLTDLGRVGTIDLQTGAATPRGKRSTGSAIKAGFTVLGNGRGVVAAGGAQGTLDTVDLATGDLATGPRLTGAPFPDLISGLAYSPSGVLYGINTSFAASSPVDLVKIDPQSGTVSRLGPMPTGTDAIAFDPGGRSLLTADQMQRQWRVGALAGLFIVAAVIILVALRRGHHHRPPAA